MPAEGPRWKLRLYWVDGTDHEWEFDTKPERTQGTDGTVRYRDEQGGKEVEVPWQHVRAALLEEIPA